MMQSSLEEKDIFKKKPCDDCKMCQSCSETRCQVCRNLKCKTRKNRLSFQEQIMLYNRLNPGLNDKF